MNNGHHEAFIYHAIISLYDHILSEAECDELPFLHFDHAKEGGLLNDYLCGERKFCSWLEALFNLAEGLALFNGRELTKINFRRLVILGIRERCLSEIEFPILNLLLRFGYDQSHDILSTDRSIIDPIVKLAKTHGLYAI